MNQSSTLWRAAAAIFTIVNVVGAVYAGAMAEWTHAIVHGAIMAGGFIAWQLLPGKREPEPAQAALGDARLDHLEQSVDAIAIGVERIGEAQRFQEKLIKKRVEEPPSPG